MAPARSLRSSEGSISRLFPVPLVRTLSESLPQAAAAESAIPSYTNPNPLIRWLMFRRLEEIRRLALDTLSRRGGNGSVDALDFGCGIGMMIPALSPHVDRLFLSDEQLGPAQATAKWFQAANVVCLRPEDLESRIEASTLEVVTAADVLEHVDSLEAVVTTLRQKLRVGGTLIVSGPTENSAYRLGRRIAGFTGEYHVCSVFHVEEVIQRSGFARERLRRLPFPVGPALFRITQWRRTT